MQVTVYATTTCPYCQMLKSYLKEKGVSFEEKLVDQNEKDKDEMMKESDGYLGVPFTLVVKDNSEKVKIVGFDKMLFDKTLQ